jgi:hypothetical protein
MLKKSLLLANIFCMLAVASFDQRPSETGKADPFCRNRGAGWQSGQ